MTVTAIQEAPSAQRCVLELDAETVLALEVATIAASTDASRPPICTVRLELNGSAGEIIATDSYMLARLFVTADGPGGTYLLSREDVLAIVKAAKGAKSSHSVLVLESETWTCSGSTTLTGGYVDDAYPNWRRIVDQHEPGTLETYGLGSTTLPKVGKIAAKLKCTFVLEFGETELKPSLWRIHNGPISGELLVMPVRVKEPPVF